MIHEPINMLQIQPYGWIQSANYIISGLFICLFAIGLRNEMASGFGIVLIPFCHLVTGLGSILMGLTIDPQTQLYVGAIIFISLISGFLLLARRFAADPKWKGWATYTILSVALMIVLCVLFANSITQQGSIAGVFERLIVGTRMVWLFFFTAKLLGGRSLAQADKRVEV